MKPTERIFITNGATVTTVPSKAWAQKKYRYAGWREATDQEIKSAGYEVQKEEKKEIKEKVTKAPAKAKAAKEPKETKTTEKVEETEQ
jgi:hypothetical protein